MYKDYKFRGKFWGLVLLGLGIFVVLSQFNIVPILSWAQMVGGVLIILAITRLFRLEFWNLVTPTLVGLWFLQDTFPVLGTVFQGTSWWMLLIAGLLIDAGLRYLFKPKFPWQYKAYYKQQEKFEKKRKNAETIIDVEVSDEDETLFDAEGEPIEKEKRTHSSSDDTSVFYVNAKLGSTTRYINSNALKEVYLNASLSGVELYFSRSHLKDGVGYLTVDINMSGIEIYVPREWRVIVELSPIMGGVDEVGASTGDGSQVLYIRGKCSMAGIEVIYV